MRTAATSEGRNAQVPAVPLRERLSLVVRVRNLAADVAEEVGERGGCAELVLRARDACRGGQGAEG